MTPQPTQRPPTARGRSSARVLGPPSTRLGWAAAGAGFGGWLLVMLNAVVMMPATGERGTMQQVILLGLVVGLLAAAVVGVVAIVRQGERSWAVLLPTSITIVSLTMELLQGLGLMSG